MNKMVESSPDQVSRSPHRACKTKSSIQIYRVFLDYAQNMSNTPNAITTGRLLIAVFGFFMMFMDFWAAAFFFILTAELLDAVDGNVARRLNQVSVTGVYFDIMTDKIVIISTFLIIGYKFDVAFFYLGLMMLIREYAVDTMRSIAATRQVVISADIFSKFKGVLFMSTMLGALGNHAYLGSAAFEQAMILLGAGGMILAYLTLGRFYLKCKGLQVF